MKDFLKVALGTPITAGNSTQGAGSHANPALNMVMCSNGVGILLK
jgi:hypothetical protein